MHEFDLIVNISMQFGVDYKMYIKNKWLTHNRIHGRYIIYNILTIEQP